MTKLSKKQIEALKTFAKRNVFLASAVRYGISRATIAALYRRGLIEAPARERYGVGFDWLYAITDAGRAALNATN